MSKAQTIFRVKKNKDNPYVMIDRRLIENPALSWKAKGLLAYLLSRPDDWTVIFGDLVKRSPDGGHTVRAAMKELRNAGHVKIKAERESGRVKQWVYTIHESPISPDDDFQQVEILEVENRTLNNKDINKDEIEEDEEPAPKNIFSVYESEIGLLTPVIANSIESWGGDVPEKWITDAISEAAKNNARAWSYVEAILKRWKAQGNQEPMKAKSNGKHATPSEPVGVSVSRSWLEKKQKERSNG